MSLPLTTVIPVALFHDGPFRWRTATRRVDDAGWLQFDPADLAADLAEKAEILERHRDDAFAVEPGSEDASREVADLVDAARGAVGLPPVAVNVSHPLERAALGVHEDLILLERRPGGWIMTAGVVCFPTRWSAADKLGRSMAQIHGPVPGYDTIAPSVDRLFDRLRSGSIVWRPNWSLVGQPDLRLPVGDRQAPAAFPADPGTALWLRAERQTIRRLEAHPDHILFTVRIHRWPLGQVVAQLDALAAELRALPDDVASYKNLEAWRHELAALVEAGRVG
ncbi:MAG: DUF3445 domain-containing protein [Actinomycetota bacterium]